MLTWVPCESTHDCPAASALPGAAAPKYLPTIVMNSPPLVLSPNELPPETPNTTGVSSLSSTMMRTTTSLNSSGGVLGTTHLPSSVMRSLHARWYGVHKG